MIKNIIIIGAMKCGTTSLYDYLIKHPEICPCVIKEPEYFSISMGHKKFKKGQYLELFNIDQVSHKFTLDASTGYTKFPTENGVPRRIKEYGLSPKFIYVIRNPYERIRSHYNFMRKDLSWEAKIDSPHLINVSKYYTQLQEFRKYFPLENFFIVDFDDLKNKPNKVCKDIFRFISASNFNPEITYEVKNKTKGVNRNFLKLKRYLSPFVTMTPSYFKDYVKTLVADLFPQPDQVQLTEEQKEKIYELLKEDMVSLNLTYNIDVSKWGF
ncbi:sulfotransferase domain-containing protein [Pontibacter flavimaris]|uniref:Sulfotransferase domain-containing protein n=1 Tax=Pontibacter flavimaris TaxID=1797110 RepID=A0A1Q5PAJ8_9BACT|nr:sulfotransferase domain-containing protein [Pontibacter flavimaris]OKL39280.1 hypothetical protein A3841_01520 [Pontibacter flavimaris]